MLMKKTTILPLGIAAIGCLFVQLQFLSCGGGGSDGSCPEPASVAGHWLLTSVITEITGNCPEPDEGEGVEEGDEHQVPCEIIQVGNQVTLYWSDGVGEHATGTVCGNLVNLHYDDTDENDGPEVVREESYEMVYSESSDSIVGTGTFHLANGSDSCVGTGDIIAVRISPAAIDESISAVTVINDERDAEALVFMRSTSQGSRRLVTLGTVPPGNAVVFPLPLGSWQVFITYPGVDAQRLNFSVAPVIPNSWNFNPVNEDPGSKSGFLLGSR